MIVGSEFSDALVKYWQQRFSTLLKSLWKGAL
nr:MAG TPA: hypothetical protein [Caudoviricetes sp.]